MFYCNFFVLDFKFFLFLLGEILFVFRYYEKVKCFFKMFIFFFWRCLLEIYNCFWELGIGRRFFKVNFNCLIVYCYWKYRWSVNCCFVESWGYKIINLYFRVWLFFFYIGRECYDCYIRFIVLVVEKSWVSIFYFILRYRL